jgi:YegS/Rv2252/BmrU family lipid kinase
MTARASNGRRTRALVIARRRTGRPIVDTVREVRRLLRRDGLGVETVVVRRKRDVRRATSRAVKDGCDLVVCVGGDGTVQQVATSLAGMRVPLAIVPTGTGNLLAGNLGIPHPVRQAVRTAVHGRPRRIDLGRVTVGGRRRAFTVACGIGFDADVMARTDSDDKGRWGKLAYVASAILETGNLGDVRHVIRLDGVRTTTEAVQVLVANFGKVPPGLRIRGVRPKDGLLDVFVIRANGPLPALSAGWEALRQDEVGESDGGRVFRARARRVWIDTVPERTVEIDGSVVGTTPVRIKVRPSALSVMVPKH